jgi:putative selenium metabolism protein SsnA
MIITNATLVTWGENPRVLPDRALYIEDGIIRAIGDSRDFLARYQDSDRLDAQGQLVMPGNICAHTHFYGAYARGIAIPGPAPASFPEILRRLWWSLDKALDKDAVYMSALVCLVDAIKHGTTTLFDHHASPNFINGSLSAIADAVEQSGLRAVLCYEVSDRDGTEKAEAAIAENVRFLNAWVDHPRLAGMFGLHAGLTLSNETLRACQDALPDGAGFHIHVAEHEADQEDSLERSGQRVVHRLNAFGILNNRSIAAHCIHINEGERDILQQNHTWITHQPRSNMNNGVGAMQFDTMMQKNMPVCLGNDGFSNNMWAEWKTAYLLHKVVKRDPRCANGGDIAKMATINNAALLTQLFPGQRLGEIAEGATADIIFVDYRPYTPLTADNLPWHILFGFEASMVTTTIVAGQLLMRDRRILTLDEKEIMNEALALAPDVWKRCSTFASEE